MYHPVNIVNDKGEVVLVLPALFIPLRPLSNNETNKAARNKFTMLGHSDIPKYASDATHGLFTAIINEQGNNGNRVAVATEEFNKCINDFNRIYNHSNNASINEDDASVLFDSVECEFD